MSRTPWALVIPLGLLLVFLAPGFAPVPSHAGSASSGAASFATVPRPVTGTVTNCTSTIACKFAFTSSLGTGWANSTGLTVTSEHMALQLPGEAKASYNLSYATYIARLTGTYTYWTVGTFLGTDVNSGNVVRGTTDTNFTITCIGHSGRGGGCTYVDTTDNGTIVVRFTNAELTSAAVACTPSTISPGQRSVCRVTVTNDWNVSNVPSGTVRAGDGRLGPLSHNGTCALVNGSCSITFRPSDNTCGLVAIKASYQGTAAFYRSSASASVDVYVSGGC